MYSAAIIYCIIYIQYAYYIINTAIIYKQHGYYICTVQYGYYVFTVRLLYMYSTAIMHVCTAPP